MNNKILEYLKYTDAIGVQREQIEKFLTWGYVPQVKQLEVHKIARQADGGDFDEIGLGGSRGGSKSHTVFAQICDDATRYDGLKILFLRSVGKTALESLTDLRNKILKHVHHEFKNGIIKFDNGSIIVTGHFRYERDLDNYIGVEYDAIAVEESTLISEAYQIRIRGSLRSSKPNWKPRAYHTTNPGGVGHVYFKRKFILPHKRKDYSVSTRFIPMGYQDNKYLDNSYVSWLQGLNGLLGKQWRDGDWEASEGTYFSNYSPDVHVVQPMPILEDWTIWGSMDIGVAHWNEFQLHARTPDDIIYTIGAVSRLREYPQTIAPAIINEFARLNIPYDKITIYAGSDAFARDSKSMRSVAEQYADYGLHLQRAIVTAGSRSIGCSEINKRLGNSHLNIQPTWYVFNDTAHRLRETIGDMLSDTKQPEVYQKVNTDPFGNGGDDPVDCLRYGIYRPDRVVLTNIYLPTIQERRL